MQLKRSRGYTTFFAVTVLFHLAASFAHPVTPTIIKTRGFGDYMFGVALAAMLVVNFLFSPFWGKLIGIISSRWVILVSSAGYAMGQAMFAAAQTELAMVVARAFAGVFTAGAFTAGLTYLVNTSRAEERSRLLTIFATIQTVASAFGFMIGGLLGELGVGFAIGAQVATLCLGGLLYFLTCVDDRAVQPESFDRRRLLHEANPVAAFMAGRQILTPLLVTIFVVVAFSNLGGTAFDQSFNYYLRAQLNLTSGYNGAIKGIVGLISLVANGTICMWLIRRTDIRRSLAAVYLLGSVAMLAVVLLDAAVPFVIANVAYFAISAVSLPLVQSLAVRAAEHRDSNLAMGYLGAMRSLGGIVGALSAGLLYSLDPKWPFVLGCLSLMVATAGTWRYYQVSRAMEGTVEGT